MPPDEALRDTWDPTSVEEDVDEYGPLPPLPEECDADKHPVVVLRNVYSREEMEADPNFFDDLEVRAMKAQTNL